MKSVAVDKSQFGFTDKKLAIIGNVFADKLTPILNHWITEITTNIYF